MSDGAKLVFGGIAAFVALILVGVVLHLTGVFVFGGVQRSTADYRGETKVIEKTRADGTYRIASYEKFFDQCASIQSKLANVAQLEDQLENGPESDKEFLQRTIVGVRAALVEDIAQYNADAAKAGTQGQFRDSRLPYNIDINAKEVTCAK